MLRILANSEYERFCLGHAPKSERCVSLYTYLASASAHESPRASDTTLWASIYDYTNDPHETHKLFQHYAWLRAHHPMLLAPTRGLEALYQADQALLKRGYASDLALLHHLTEHPKTLQSYGWGQLPSTLTPHLLASPASWSQARSYFWDIQSSPTPPPFVADPKTAVVCTETDRPLLELLLARSGYTTTALRSLKLGDEPELIRYISLLKQEHAMIHVHHLSVLIDHAHPCATLLRQYPTTYTDWTQASHYLAQHTHSDWFHRLGQLIPAPNAVLSHTEARQCLHHLHHHLRAHTTQTWLRWMNAIAPLKNLKFKRPAHEWWMLFEQAAQLTPHPTPLGEVLLIPADFAFYGPYDTLILTSRSLDRLHVPEHIPLSQAHEAQRRHIQVQNTLNTLLASCLTPSPPAPEPPQRPTPAPEPIATPEARGPIRWVRDLSAQQRCPRYGWITRHLNFNPTPPPLSSTSPQLRGQLLHDWMSSQLEVNDFLSDWSDRHAYPLHEAERRWITAPLISIKKQWANCLSEDPWLDQQYEVRYDLSLAGFNGSLRIDCLLKHPEGYVIIDFKSSLPSLSELETHAALMPQLPLYCLAQNEPVVAVAYVHLDPNQMNLLGYSCLDLHLIKKTHEPSAWQALQMRWRHEIESTLAQMASGDMSPTPFVPHHRCEHCPVYSLCQPS